MAAKLIIAKCLLLMALTPSRSPLVETNAGIFLVVKNEKICEKRVFNIDKKVKVCVTPEPILAVDNFTSVSSIVKRDSLGVNCYFNLGFSQTGMERLKKIYTTLPQAELVLVVDNTVVGFITNLNTIRNKSLAIEGNEKDLILIHEKFKVALGQS